VRRLCFLASVVPLLGVLGCGDGIKRVPVQGKLTVNGNPVEDAYVQFIPARDTRGEGGMGRTDRDGNFSLEGMKGVRGVAPGEYKVRVSRLVLPDGKPLPWGATEADNPGCRESIPPPYSTPESPLAATVPESGGTINIGIPAKLLAGK
jgi:hypothetical protein